MDLLRIGDTKLKVTLTGEDMERYSLDGESMDYDTTETRSAFWQILDEAKHRTGFDAGGERLFVQVYPSRGGGCEMYITLLSDEEKPAVRAALGICSLYSFGSLATLTTVCRKLSELGYTEPSAAYATEEGYSLVVTERCEGGIGEYPFLEEYGTRSQSGARLAYLKEHGRCLEELDAVGRFAAL